MFDNENLIFLSLLPLITALIGWGTNLLAVKMLFRPRKPINVLGIKIIGLIPKRKEDLADSIGRAVSEKLLNMEDIIAEAGLEKKLPEIAEQELDNFVKEKLGDNLIVEQVMAGEFGRQIKGQLSEHLSKRAPALVSGMLGDSVDTKALVKSKIQDFDLETLENMVLDVASKELRAIEIWGGILGFFIGLAQVSFYVLVNS